VERPIELTCRTLYVMRSAEALPPAKNMAFASLPERARSGGDPCGAPCCCRLCAAALGCLLCVARHASVAASRLTFPPGGPGMIPPCAMVFAVFLASRPRWMSHHPAGISQSCALRFSGCPCHGNSWPPSAGSCSKNPGQDRALVRWLIAEGPSRQCHWRKPSLAA